MPVCLRLRVATQDPAKNNRRCPMGGPADTTSQLQQIKDSIFKCEEMPTRRCVDLCEYMEDCARYTNDQAQTDEATKAWALDRWGSQSFLMTGREE